jgi:CheY-like chemotaxis protein
VVFEVTDTGPGIPSGKVSLVFEPFVQASASDASMQSGAGLGLAIVRELARLMDGAATVSSRLGHGSTFAVEMRLPLDPEADGKAGPEDLLPTTRTPVPRSAPPATIRARVLVCEDNPVNQKVLVAMLERLGHDAVVAPDGLAAWEILRDQQFDVVLTDIEMPGMDGFELTRRIRARERESQSDDGRAASHVPIVGATAHVGEDERQRLLAIGMDAHLGKPFTLAELSSVLMRAVAARPPRD